MQTRLFFNGCPVHFAFPYDDLQLFLAIALNKTARFGGLSVADVRQVYSIITGDDKPPTRPVIRGLITATRGPIETDLSDAQLAYSVLVPSMSVEDQWYTVSRAFCSCPDGQRAPGDRGHGEICKHQCWAIEWRLI